MAKELNLPELEAYTREQLAKKWDCDISLVKGYIDSGQLKEALPPDAMRVLYMRGCFFYKCESNEPLLDAFSAMEVEIGSSSELLLELIEDGEPLEKYVGRITQGKIIPCPKHLYLAVEDNASIKRSDKDYNMVRYFYDLHGNALIPIEYEEDGHQICFAPIKKKHLDSSIILIEEVKRFLETRKKSSATVDAPKEKKTKREGVKDTDIPLPKPTDNLPDKPPDDDYLIDIKEVCKRINKSKGFVYQKMKEGKFPKSKKDGGRTDWRNSDIAAYVAGTWEPTDKAEKPNE